MLTDLVDRISWYVRALVAFGTGVRLSSHLYGKLMSRVTCCARSQTAIRVESTHSLIGPA